MWLLCKKNKVKKMNKWESEWKMEGDEKKVLWLKIAHQQLKICIYLLFCGVVVCGVHRCAYQSVHFHFLK